MYSKWWLTKSQSLFQVLLLHCTVTGICHKMSQNSTVFYFHIPVTVFTKDFLELWIYCSKRLYLEVECCKTFSCTSTEKKNSFSYTVKMQFQKGLITFIFLLNPLLIIWDENKIELFPKSVYQCFFSEKCRIVIWELGNDLDPK